MDLKKIFGKNVDLSSLSTGEKPSKEAVAQAEYRSKNPIDLNKVPMSDVFPVCQNIKPQRSALGLSNLEDFRRGYAATIHLSFDEIMQVMTKFVAENPSLQLHISPACTGMTLIHENFSCNLSFYIDDLDAKQVSYKVADQSKYLMYIRRNSGDAFVFYENESRFYDLLLNGELSRQYIAGTYELPYHEPEPVFLTDNKNLSFDDLQEDI